MHGEKAVKGLRRHQVVIRNYQLCSDDRRHRSGNHKKEPTHPQIHQPKLLVVDGKNEILNPTGQCAVFFPGSCRVRFGADFFGGNRNAVGHRSLFQGSQVSQDRLNLFVIQLHIGHQATRFEHLGILQPGV